MTTTLIDRYVATAVDRVPESRRRDVGAEIRGAIDEMVERRIEAGEPEDAAIRSSLNELGDPRALAEAYEEKPRYLIGPVWYSMYIEVLKRVLGVALPLVAVFAILTTLAVDDASIGDAVQDALGSAYGVGIQVLLWVTVGFVIAERTMTPADLGLSTKPWTVDALPEAPARRQIGLGEMLPTVIMMVFLGTVAIVQHDRGVGALILEIDDEGYEHLSLVNPDLGAGWVVGFFALLALTAVLAIVRYTQGVWAQPMLLATVVEAALWIGFVFALAFAEPMFNPELALHIGDEPGDWWKAGERVNLIVAVIVSATSLWEVWEAYRGHMEYQQMEGARISA